MLLFPDLPSLKLVEPGRDEGVVRVETMVRVSGVLGSGSGYRVPVVVSTQPFADAHVLAQPASGDMSTRASAGAVASSMFAAARIRGRWRMIAMS